MINPRRIAIIVLATLFSLMSEPHRLVAQLPVTELSVLSRTAAQTGSEFDLTVVAGNHLEEVDRLIFSHPQIMAQGLSDDPRPFTAQRVPRYKQFHVTVPVGLTTGFYEARVGGRLGLSNPRLLLVTSLPTTIIEGVGDVTAQVPELPQQTIVQGKTTANTKSFYRFKAPVGTKWRIDCIAQRLDSQLLPSMAVLDSKGRELVRDFGTDERDAVCYCTAIDDQPLTLVLHDALYRGGDEFYYQLFASPLSDPSPGSLEVLRCLDPTLNSADASPVSDGRLLASELAQALPMVKVDPPISAVHEESQFVGQQPQPISMPMRVQGWFETRDDVDRYAFQGQPGQEWVFEILSDRLGSHADPVLRIERIEPQESGSPKRTTVAEQDDPAMLGDASTRVRIRDPSLRLNPPAAGEYHVVVRDLDTGGRSPKERPYVFVAREVKPDFGLIAYPSPVLRDVTNARPTALQLTRGSTVAIRVAALRQDGFNDAIELTVEGLPNGIRCARQCLSGNQTETHLILVAAEDSKAWEGPFQVIGRAASVPEAPPHKAVAATMSRASAPGRARMSSRLSTSLWLSVSDQDLSPIQIALGNDEVMETARGGNLSIPVRVTRRAGGDQNCVLRPRDLPPNVTAGEVTINGDKNEGSVEFKTTVQTTPGEYVVWMQGETKVKLATNPQAMKRAEAYRDELQAILKDPNRAADAEKVKEALKTAETLIEQAKAGAQPRDFNTFLPSSAARIRVLEAPFNVSVPPPAPCPVDKTTDVIFEIERKLGFDGAIEIAVAGGLENTKIQAKPQAIAAGTSRGVINLQVPGDVPPSERQLNLKLSYTFNNQKIEIQRSIPVQIVPAS